MSESEYDIEKEIKFAENMYVDAVVGLEPGEYPPVPSVWLLTEDNWKILSKNWEMKKVELIGLIESKDSEISEDKKNGIAEFLSCKLAVYLDLMSSIGLMKYGTEEEKKEAMKPRKVEVEDMDVDHVIKINEKKNIE